MEAELYCSVLQNTLLPFIRDTLPNRRFMHDNDPKHTSRLAKAVCVMQCAAEIIQKKIPSCIRLIRFLITINPRC